MIQCYGCSGTLTVEYAAEVDEQHSGEVAEEVAVTEHDDREQHRQDETEMLLEGIC